MDHNSLYLAMFHTDICYYEKSTLILHLHIVDYFSRLVYSLNIRPCGSIRVLNGMRPQALG